MNNSQQKRSDDIIILASNEPCHSSIAHSKGKKSSNVLFQKMQHEKFCRAPEHQTIAEAHGKLMREQMLHEEVELRNYHQSLPNTASEMQIEHQTKCEARAIEEPKRFLVRDVPKPRLKILKDDEETNSSAYLSNKFFSPNLFTASPIPYVGVSPMQMNLKTFLYEFNDNAILNGMHIPTRTKDAHQRGNYAQSKQFHAIPSQSKLHAVGRSQRSDPQIDRRYRITLSYFTNPMGITVGIDLSQGKLIESMRKGIISSSLFEECLNIKILKTKRMKRMRKC